jgi:hypothetical protein
LFQLSSVMFDNLPTQISSSCAEIDLLGRVGGLNRRLCKLFAIFASRIGKQEMLYRSAHGKD